MQASRDHQVQHQPEIVVEADGDALTNAAQLADDPALCFCDGRLRSAQQRDAGDAYAFEPLSSDARLERGEVCGDIGQLGHAYQIARCCRVPARWNSFRETES